MKVLHITNNYPTDHHPIFGIFVKEQIDSLIQLGLENQVFFINGREKGRLEYIKSIFRLSKFLRNNNFDIIHCHHAFSAVCFILSGQAKKSKSVVSYQNDPVNENGKKLYDFIRTRVDAIIFKNNSSNVDNMKIFCQPNGVNIDFFKPISKDESIQKLNLDPSKRYILFVSSNFIREQKRYDRFCETLNVLRNEYGLSNIVELKLINTKRELVPYYFNAASLHLLTSDFEGSPNSVKEAMACNIPVVSTNVGNVGELLADVNGSYVSETKTSEELARLARIALSDQVVNNGREIIQKKKLDIESVAERILNIYYKILNYN
jgi:teichuronic acid biosynthesis glycosyltransferase TuaC